VTTARLRIALTAAWLLMIVAEQINAKSGIGYLMNEARAWFRTDIIVLGLAIYGALGLLTDGIVRLLERTMLSWRRGFSGT
jgi:sulfonate transport system permease protein